MAPASQPTDNEQVRAAVSARYSSLARAAQAGETVTGCDPDTFTAGGFGLDASGYRVGQHVLTLAGRVQTDQRGTAGGVAHSFHQFAEVRREGRDISQASPA